MSEHGRASDGHYVQNLLAGWEKFYSEVLGIEMGEVQVPEHQPGFDRLIVIAQGLTLNQAFAVCKERFGSWSYVDDLDKGAPINDRDSSQAYAIWIRDRVEADEELKSKSANGLEQEGIPGITLLERIILELKYYRETGGHLDIKSRTLCSGSRYSDGGVPECGWYGGGFYVGWHDPSGSDSYLRSREAVS